MTRHEDLTLRPAAGLVAAFLALLTALAWPAPAAAADSEADRAWPVAGTGVRGRPVVERGFEPPPSPWVAGHRGADLRAAPGAPVRAAAPGRVSFAGRIAGRGVVSIELTGTGRPPRITYQPVDPLVSEGDEVTAGQLVGTLQGGPFHCLGGCLHWGLLRGDRYLDPLSLLPSPMRRGGPSRLLPVFGVPLPATGAAPALIAGAVRALHAEP